MQQRHAQTDTDDRQQTAHAIRQT